MRLLLDTHALLWWFLGDAHLSPAAADAVAAADGQVYVSAASAWEITTKVRLGKLPRAEGLAADLEKVFCRSRLRSGTAAWREISRVCTRIPSIAC